MRKIAFSILIACAALACNTVTRYAETPPALPGFPSPTPADLPASEDDVPRISAEDAKTALDTGEAIILDVRSAELYNAGHIKGAMNIPLNLVELDPVNINLKKDRWIITYCT